MGSIWLDQVCHYGNHRAQSVDHIVPRVLLPKPLSRMPAWFRAMNEVASCKKCNNDKGDLRGWCYCHRCRGAFVTAKSCGFIQPMTAGRRAEFCRRDAFYVEYLEDVEIIDDY